MCSDFGLGFVNYTRGRRPQGSAGSTGPSNPMAGGSEGGWSTGAGQRGSPAGNRGDWHKAELLLNSVIKGEMEIKLPEIKQAKKKVASEKIRRLGPPSLQISKFHKNEEIIS